MLSQWYLCAIANIWLWYWASDTGQIPPKHNKPFAFTAERSLAFHELKLNVWTMAMCCLSPSTTHARMRCYHLFSPPPRQCKDWLTRHVCKPCEAVKPEEGQPSRCCDNERNASVLMMWRYAPSWLVCEMPRRRWCRRDKFIKWPRD